MTLDKGHTCYGAVMHTEPGMQCPGWRRDNGMIIHCPRPPIYHDICRPVVRLLQHINAVDRDAIPLRTAVDASLVGQGIEPRGCDRSIPNSTVG